MLSSILVLIPFLVGINAANDWKKPCTSGRCSYDMPSVNGSSSGTLNIWGSENAITDITAAAGWEILGCDPGAVSQDIRLVCLDGPDDPNSKCAHLFQNIGAVHKIVRLPQNCGANAFARISRSWVHADQTIPASVRRRLVRRGGVVAQPVVQALALDTDFGAVDHTKTGEVHFSIMSANVPGVALDSPEEPQNPSERRNIDARSPFGFSDIKKAANKVADTTKDAAKATGDAAKDAAKATGDAAKTAAKATADGAKAAGKATGDAAKAVGDVAEDAAKVTADGAKAAGKATVDAAKAAGNKVVDVASDVADAAGDVVDVVGDVASVVVGAFSSSCYTAYTHSHSADNKITVDKTFSLGSLSFDKTVNLIDSTLDCSGSVAGIQGNLNAALRVDLAATANAEASVTVAASGKVIPPSLTSFSVIAGMNANVAGTMTMTADVSGHIDSGKSNLVSTRLPGINFPGILTVGPTFKVDAQIVGDIELSMDMTVGLNFDVNNAQIAFPASAANKVDGGSFKAGDTPLTLNVDSNIQASGSLTMHLIPSINLGIDALGGKGRAQLFLALDTNAALTLTLDGSSSKTKVKVISGGTDTVAEEITDGEDESTEEDATSDVAADGATDDAGADATDDAEASDATDEEATDDAGAIDAADDGATDDAETADAADDSEADDSDELAARAIKTRSKVTVTVDTDSEEDGAAFKTTYKAKTKAPVDSDPTADDSATADAPAAKTKAKAKVTADETAADDSATDDTTADSAVEDAVADDSAADDAAADDSAAEDATADSAVEDATADDTAADDEATEDTAAADTAAGNTAADDEAVDNTATDGTAADDETADDTAADDSAADDTAATDDEPANADDSEATETADEEAAASDSADDETADETTDDSEDLEADDSETTDSETAADETTDEEGDTTTLDNAAGTSGMASGCVRLNGGFNLKAGVEGNFFGLFKELQTVSLYNKNFKIFEKCFGDQDAAAIAAADAAADALSEAAAEESSDPSTASPVDDIEETEITTARRSARLLSRLERQRFARDMQRRIALTCPTAGVVKATLNDGTILSEDITSSEGVDPTLEDGADATEDGADATTEDGADATEEDATTGEDADATAEDAATDDADAAAEDTADATAEEDADDSEEAA